MMPSSHDADITLLLEGTYPFTRGGVSSWAHQLIEGLPERSFNLVHLGAKRRGEEVTRYKLPPNVKQVLCFYLMDDVCPLKPVARAGCPKYFDSSSKLHDWFRSPIGEPSQEWVDQVILQNGQKPEKGTVDFFTSEAAWAQICASYSQNCPDESFNAYFWAVRNMHAPLMKMANFARAIPPSTVFHALSTGYAGLLGAMLKQLTGRPLILTEHGIYTKERRIDLQSLFLEELEGWFEQPSHSGMQYHKLLWSRMFEGMGRLTYSAANPIITLYELNRQHQISDGADPARTLIIPNGVHVEFYAPLRALRPREIPRVLGLIGRIVPIKDIKTFIRAIAVLAASMPDIEGWLIGPEEEDPTYVNECRALVTSLRLEDHIRFLGFQKVEDVLPKLGLLVLTSISEAFPLVIGESHASGLPVLATDVGACRDLIEGKGADDRMLGFAGEVIPIADPEAIARAAFGLLTDPARWQAAQRAGIERVERYYRQSQVIDSYREIYQRIGAL